MVAKITMNNNQYTEMYKTVEDVRQGNAREKSLKKYLEKSFGSNQAEFRSGVIKNMINYGMKTEDIVELVCVPKKECEDDLEYLKKRLRKKYKDDPDYLKILELAYDELYTARTIATSMAIHGMNSSDIAGILQVQEDELKEICGDIYKEEKWYDKEEATLERIWKAVKTPNK